MHSLQSNKFLAKTTKFGSNLLKFRLFFHFFTFFYFLNNFYLFHIFSIFFTSFPFFFEYFFNIFEFSSLKSGWLWNIIVNRKHHEQFLIDYRSKILHKSALTVKPSALTVWSADGFNSFKNVNMRHLFLFYISSLIQLNWL